MQLYSLLELKERAEKRYGIDVAEMSLKDQPEPGDQVLYKIRDVISHDIRYLTVKELTRDASH